MRNAKRAVLLSNEEENTGRKSLNSPSPPNYSPRKRKRKNMGYISRVFFILSHCDDGSPPLPTAHCPPSCPNRTHITTIPPPPPPPPHIISHLKPLLFLPLNPGPGDDDALGLTLLRKKKEPPLLSRRGGDSLLLSPLPSLS